MKERVTVAGLLSQSNDKELKLLHTLIKKHSYFRGERKRLYSLIVKYKKK